jgi:hypothetical protein
MVEGGHNNGINFFYHGAWVFMPALDPLNPPLIYTLCCVIYLACMMLGKTNISLNPGCRVIRNTLCMMKLMGVMHKSKMTCLKRQTSHFTIRLDIANLVPLYICTT